MEEPNTIVIVGMPAADRRDRFLNDAPPALNTSACFVRSAPPDSVNDTSGNRLTREISMARKAFATVMGACAPPFTVGSLALTMHSTPAIRPMPVTRPVPRESSEPQPASGDSSRNAEPGSRRQVIRSRGSSLPRSRCRATERASLAGSPEPPPRVS